MKKLKTAILILFLSFSINIVPDFNPSETPEANTNLAAIENAISASDPTLYFESATFDYYLGKNADGTSRMRVKETYEAVFSDTSTSHGLTREIPFLNQNGTNQIIDELNLKVTRNGKYEPIAKKERINDYYKVNIGSSSVTVQGPQTYVLEYEFNNVITEFDELKNNISGQKSPNTAYQELYWNTNGIGWSNRFEILTANVHFEDGIKYQEDFNTNTINGTSTTASKQKLYTNPYCYTGPLNSKSSNCVIIDNPDGFSFVTTKPLNMHENLSFAIMFVPNTFTVKEIKKNYILVAITSVFGVFCVLIIVLFIRSYKKKASKKRAYVKSLFVAPQYQPPKDITVAEAGEIYPKAKRPTYVATLLELATQHKIQFISEKRESKILKNEITVWRVKVLSDEKLTSSQQAVLKILNNGVTAKAGGEIVVEKHTATSSLASTARSYTTSAISLLKSSGYLEQKSSITSIFSRSSAVVSNVILWFIVIVGFSPFLFLPLILVNEWTSSMPGIVVGKEVCIIIAIAILIATIIICSYIASVTARYKNITYKGLDLINYLKGLYLYIDMAEEERLEFNQSVKNAPRTNEKIVKLYEKLLPYACIFGLEESWFNELDKYYKNLDYDPDWYSGSEMFSYYAFSRMVNTTSSAISSTTSYSSSSSGGGGFSSGGGGGGFSGGGGGGGGGGSW